MEKNRLSISKFFCFLGEVKKTLSTSRENEVYSLASKLFKQMQGDNYLPGGLTPTEMYEFMDILKGKIEMHKLAEINRLENELTELKKLP